MSDFFTDEQTEFIKRIINDFQPSDVSSHNEPEHGPSCPPSCSHDHSREHAIFERTNVEKFEAINILREKGNEKFRNNNFGAAAVFYRQALMYIDYTFPETPHETNIFKSENLKVLLNLAICKERLNEWAEAVKFCKRAIQIDQKSAKAHYRLGLAQTELGLFDEAEESLKTAYTIEQDVAIEVALKRLSKLRVT